MPSTDSNINIVARGERNLPVLGDLAKAHGQIGIDADANVVQHGF